MKHGRLLPLDWLNVHIFSSLRVDLNGAQKNDVDDDKKQVELASK